MFDVMQHIVVIFQYFLLFINAERMLGEEYY